MLLSKNDSFFSPFQARVPILYPLKTPENLSFSGVFRGYKMEALVRNELIKSIKTLTEIYILYVHNIFSINENYNILTVLKIYIYISSYPTLSV